MKNLWNKDKEVRFFREALEDFATPEQLFYVSNEGKYYAYWPKGYEGPKTTLQSRNSLIGNYTEKWGADLIKEFAEERGCYVVQGAICDEIGLANRSNADIAICKTKDIIQQPDNILLIIEVKMSIVWNWELKIRNGKREFIPLGDYKTHQGNPGLLRSDSMLKAIGKSINIRVSGNEASKIPIIILGNTPITNSYYEKVDHLRKSGVIQGFWSVNPNPLDSVGNKNIKSTKGLGFYRYDSYEELKGKLEALLKEKVEFFSGMRSKSELGRIIEIASKESTVEKKAEKFLELIKQ